MDKKAKMYTIIALLALLVVSAVIAYAANTDSAPKADAGGVKPMACSNFCSWCVPVNGGSCNSGGSCC